jgi:hypothetical protein
MCSGCSDYYDGDEESERSGMDAAMEVEFKVERCDGSSVGYSDDYVILVSDSHIIERHALPTKCGVSRAQEVAGGQQTWLGSRQDQQRSRGRSANTYRTQGGWLSEPNDGARGASICFALWGLAGVAAVVVTVWLVGR